MSEDAQLKPGKCGQGAGSTGLRPSGPGRVGSEWCTGFFNFLPRYACAAVLYDKRAPAIRVAAANSHLEIILHIPSRIAQVDAGTRVAFL